MNDADCGDRILRTVLQKVRDERQNVIRTFAACAEAVRLTGRND